jgi:hypothetical protein
MNVTTDNNNTTKSEIFSDALRVCEKACSLRKQMAEEKKTKGLQNDEDVFVRGNKELYQSRISEIENDLNVIAEKLKNVGWGFSYFWNQKMKRVKGYKKTIHFYPTKVIKFVDWSRFSFNRLNK